MRRRILRALHAAAALLPHARQGRVTDKGKEQPGSLPSLTYGPVAVPRPTAREAVQLSVVDMSSSHSVETAEIAGSSSSAAGTSSSTRSQHVLYRSGDVVYTCGPTTGGLWVAQLGSAIIKQTIQDGRRRKNSFNVDRVHCRYFVQTSELGTYPHAMAWWSERGAALRITSEAGAQERASSSSGVHFSFEKRDRVTAPP